MRTRNLCITFCWVLLLAGCNSELYRQLGEAEANEMLALLMVKGIPAEKVVEKDGSITLKVDDNAFVQAVELMRQNGFPRKLDVTVEQLFPTGQLVTSPAQERAKMVFLKERRLESMLSSMDGVVEAKVTLGDAVDENGNAVSGTRAGIFIKYSPEFNMSTRQAEIKALIMNSVPDLKPEEISLVMQPSLYRLMPVSQTWVKQPAWVGNKRVYKWLIALCVGFGTMALVAGIVVWWANRRRTILTANS
jgi:type III secretion protein J